MAQDPPEVTWAVDAVVVGVVVAGVNVVVDFAVVVGAVPDVDEAVDVVEETAAEEGLDVVEEVLDVVEEAVDLDAVAAVRLEETCAVWADARPAKRATPPAEAAATAAVIRRVRRRMESREAGEVMGPLSVARLGGS